MIALIIQSRFGRTVRPARWLISLMKYRDPDTGLLKPAGRERRKERRTHVDVLAF